ncbi:hypothetical protein ACHQM5_007772 [Ranunculus cassubicifolius]
MEVAAAAENIVLQLGWSLDDVPPPSNDEDVPIWPYTKTGKFTVSSAYEAIRKKSEVLAWAKVLSKSLCHPRDKALAWKIIHGAIPTDDYWLQRDYNIPSRCSVCGSDTETQQHLLFLCVFAKDLWSRISNALK